MPKKNFYNTDFEEKVIGPTLARVFSASVFNELANKGFSPSLNLLLKELHIEVSCYNNLGEVFEFIYKKLSKNYRNEYLYKNSIANKILLGKHSLNTASMYSEFRVASSKADALILNGTTHIYEIKTELDSLERLEQQVSDYQNFAEFVSVITDKKHLEKILDKIPENIGVIEFTAKDTFKAIRLPASNRNKLCRYTLFDSLRKNEYIDIISNYYGKVPDVPNTVIYKECKKLFIDIPVNIAHTYTLEKLKNRFFSEKKNKLISLVPKSLKVSVACSQLSSKQINNLSLVFSKGILK